MTVQGYGYRAPLGEDFKPKGDRLVHLAALESLSGDKETVMKRTGNLFERIVSDSNLEKAIEEVNKSHRWNKYPTKPNKVVMWVEANKDDCIKELKRIITNGYVPSKVTVKKRYDANARKWREIAEPKLYPDQYIHHALIQVIEPIMLRGMDRHVCGSIKGRGVHYGMKRIKKWMKTDIKGTKWCAELDIKKFYPSIKSSIVIERFKHLIKDHRTLDLIERITKDGVLIGAYTSQWFANTVLQPLDARIRELKPNHYIRYADNFTIFSSTKKTLRKIVKEVNKWLKENGMALKENHQIFQTRHRIPDALGYRYKRGFTLIRKHSLLRLRRQLRRFYSWQERGIRTPLKFCRGLLSRLGMLRHCNSRYIYKKYIKPKTQRKLKAIVRFFSIKEAFVWNMFLEQQKLTAQSANA